MSAASTYPSFLARGAARALDLALHVGLLELAGRSSEWLSPWALLHPSEQTLQGVDLAVGVAALVLGPALAEWVGGATLGKLLLGLRVIGEDDGAFSFGRAVTRNVALALDALVFGLVAYSTMSRSPLRQRLGDLWGRTVVVRSADAPPRNAIGGAILGLAVPFALLLASYLVAA